MLQPVSLAAQSESWSLGRWYRGFESRLNYEYLSSYFCVVLSSVRRDFRDRLITRPKEQYRVSKYSEEPPCVSRHDAYNDYRATDEGRMNHVTTGR
jgi:hypothetical protein